MQSKQVTFADKSVLSLSLLPEIKLDLKSVSKNIKPTKNGYGGFAKKSYLLNYVKREVFSNSKLDFAALHNNIEEITPILVKSIKSLRKVYNIKDNLEIYIFPTLSEFVRKRMRSVHGFAPYKNVIHIYIHENALEKKYFTKALQATIAHEYNHLMRYEYFIQSKKLLEDLVLEGLAENFRELIFPDKPAPWAIALTKSGAKKSFDQLKPLLEPENYNFEVFNDVFFGSKKYKRWTGYSTGYYLVKDYIKSLDKIDWKEIMKTSAERIALDSNWLKE